MIRNPICKGICVVTCFTIATADGWIWFCHRKHWRAAAALFTTLGSCSVFLKLTLTYVKLHNETTLSKILSFPTLTSVHCYVEVMSFLGMLLLPVHSHAFPFHTVDWLLTLAGLKAYLVAAGLCVCLSEASRVWTHPSSRVCVCVLAGREKVMWSSTI